jgi:hypothetical protein
MLILFEEGTVVRRNENSEGIIQRENMNIIPLCSILYDILYILG